MNLKEINSFSDEDFLDLDEISELIDENLINEDEELDKIPKSQQRNFFLYELKKLFKNRDNALITFSPNSVNLLIIEKEEYVQISGWVPEADSFEYLTKQSISNIDGEIDIVQKNEQTFYSYVDINGGIKFDNGKKFEYLKNRLYLVSPIKIETEQDILNYSSFVQSLKYENGLTANRNGKKIFSLVDLETWTTRDGNQAIIRFGKQLNDFKFHKVKLTSPSSFLLDSIRITGIKNGELTSPIITMSNELTPLWMNPIEKISGEINFLNYWFSNNIFSLEKIWSFGSKDQIYLNSLLPTNNDQEGDGYTKTFGNVVDAEIQVEDLIPFFQVYQGANKWSEERKSSHQLDKKDLKFSNNNLLNNVIPKGYVNDYEPIQSFDFIQENMNVDGATPIARVTRVGTNKINSVTLKIKEKIFISSLYELLNQVLTASFNYNNNFKGAGYKNEVNGELNEMALYKQEFEGKNIVEYISGIEKAWEKKNTTIVNNDNYRIYYQNYKIIKAMLSSYLYGENAIASGGNEDYKFLLPWFFELETKPNWVGSGKEDDGSGKWEYNTDLIVKLNSKYFDFDFPNKKITLKNTVISEKEILNEMKSSWFWPSIPDKIDETQLPSLTAIDFKLSDDNVGKYLVYDIPDSKKNYGNKNSFMKTTLNKIQNLNEYKSKKWEFDLDLEIPKELEISGIYGSGSWDLELIGEKEENIKITALALFKVNKQDIGKMKIVL